MWCVVTWYVHPVFVIEIDENGLCNIGGDAR